MYILHITLKAIFIIACFWKAERQKLVLSAGFEVDIIFNVCITFTIRYPRRVVIFVIFHCKLDTAIYVKDLDS